MNRLLLCTVFVITQTACLGLLVRVQDTRRYTMLFSSVLIRCEYSTASQAQDVLVTWRYKSFCKDPIMDYYSSSYIAMLSMGQDPTNDCQDDTRQVRIVIQKRGQNEPTLGTEYRQRKITIQNQADLLITEVMWWDHGVYFCHVEAPGDTTGDPDKEVRLIVLHWLTVLFIILGALLLFILIGVCFCQCCPQCCCCYLQCICCPKRCCCPEKALLRHELFKQAKKGLFPWMDPSMYGDEERHTFMPPYHPNMPIPREYSMKNSIPLSVVPYSAYPSSSNKMLEYIEHEVKNMNASQSLQNGIHISGSSHPSILSSLDTGVREVERRVIQLPPLLQQIPEASLPSSHRTGNSSHRNDRSDERQPRHRRSQEGSRSTRSSRDRRYNRPAAGSWWDDDPEDPRRGLPPRGRFHGSLSDDSDYGERARRSGSGHRRGRRGHEEGGRRERRGNSADRSPERRSGRRERSYSPPPRGRRRASWSSLDNYEHGGAHYNRADNRMANWLESLKKPLKYHEKPPSYHSVDAGSQESSARRSHNTRQSDRGSSRSGKSVVI